MHLGDHWRPNHPHDEQPCIQVSAVGAHLPGGGLAICRRTGVGGRISKNEVQAALARHRQALRLIFTHYANLDGGSGPGQATVNVKEFTMMLKDAGMIDFSLSLNNILTIFNNIQQADGEFGHAEEAEMMASELIFAEFLEGMAACAVFKMPNPYVVLEQRIDRFLKDFVSAMKKGKQKIKGLRTVSGK